MVLIILGLVCKLTSKNTPPKHTTHNKSVNNRKKFLCMDKIEQKKKIMERFNKNIEYTKMCLRYCKLNNIESYRISVGLIPNYEDWNWCNDETVIKKLLELKEYDINFTFHADHYVKLGSLKDEVNKKAIFTYKHYYLPLAKLLNIHSICFHMAGYTDGKQKYFNKLLQTFH
jgi:UV DNA damage repair endonuclease